MSNYLNLSTPAPRRLAILKNSAAKLNAGYNLRKSVNDTRPYTWRDVRYTGFHNSRTSRCELSPGFNDNGKTEIYYCHTGPYFPREKFADEFTGIHGRPLIDHTGWYADSDGHRTIRGLIVRLPHGRYMAGYYCSDNDERVYYPDIYNDERAAVYEADGHAERTAEKEREYAERYNAARELEDTIEEKLERLKECLALRNNPCFKRVRSEITRLTEDIKAARHDLKDSYSNFI